MAAASILSSPSDEHESESEGNKENANTDVMRLRVRMRIIVKAWMTLKVRGSNVGNQMSVFNHTRFNCRCTKVENFFKLLYYTLRYFKVLLCARNYFYIL
jgi:hypothetical protein